MIVYTKDIASLNVHHDSLKADPAFSLEPFVLR